MIAKCVAILAVVAQINASGCGCSLSSMVGSTPLVLISSGNSGFSQSPSGSVTRNIVAKGKYPVALRSCGPSPAQISIINSRVTAPVQEKPTVRLPASIPAPRTISHSCTCYKTVLKPRIHQQLITVPTLQRYVETTHKPVLENIQYEALPVTCNESGVQIVQIGDGCSGSDGLATVASGSLGSQVQNIASATIPQIHSPEVSRIQVFETPRIQPFQVPETETLQIQQPASFGSCSC